MKTPIFLALFLLLAIGTNAQTKALACVEYDNEFGYINKNGEMVIPAKFEDAGNFSNGLAAAYDGDKWGYIDPNGTWAIEPQFEHVKKFDSGIAVVETDDGWRYIDKWGNLLNISKGDKIYDFHEGVAFVRQGDNIGLMNTQGEIILEPQFKKITGFPNGYGRFLTFSDQWGILDSKGNIIVEAKYDDIGLFVNGVAWVRNGEQMGLVNGKEYIKIDAKKIWDFAPGVNITYAEKNELIGFMNKKGEWVIPPKFEEAKRFSKGLAPAYDGDAWGFIDKTGKFVIEPQYENAEYFSEGGLAPVEIDGDWGFIDTQGNLVIEPEYGITVGGLFSLAKSIFGAENQKGFVNGTARVEYKRDVGFIDEKGNALGGKWYDSAKPFVEIKAP